MKRSLKHGGFAALRVGAALGLTTVGVVAVGATPAFANTVSVPQVTNMVYSSKHGGKLKVTGNGAFEGALNAKLQIFPPHGHSYFVVEAGQSSSGALTFDHVGSLSPGTYVGVSVGKTSGDSNRGELLPNVGNALWVMGNDGTLTSVRTSTVSASDYPVVSTPVYSLNTTNSTADVTLNFTGPTSTFQSSILGTLKNFTVTASQLNGTVVGSTEVTPDSSGQYSANLSGLTFGGTYLYAVTANYLPSGDTAAPVPLTSYYQSTVPAQSTLTPTLPQVNLLTPTPGYADQSTFANPQETIKWSAVQAQTIDNETYTPTGYLVTYTPQNSSGQPSSQTIQYVKGDTTQQAQFGVQPGATYKYSVSVLWSDSNGSVTGAPSKGTFVANSALGVPTLTSLTSGEFGQSTLEINGSFTTPAQPSSSAAGINAQYQVILTDGTSSYKVYQTPVTLGWGQSLDFSVTNSEFDFKVGDTVTAVVRATFYDGSSVVGISNSNPSPITVSNSAVLPGPQNVVFAMSADLGGTVSWTGPIASGAPKGFALNGFTVEIVDSTNNSRVYWVDNNVAANSSGTAYNVAIPAGITSGFSSDSTYEALVFANYTDTAESSQMTVSASASDSMYMPSQSLLSLTAPQVKPEYVKGTPALQVSWDASPSIPTSDNTGSIAPSSYTLLYAPLGADGKLRLSDVQSMIGITPGTGTSGVTSATLSGLAPGTQYGVIVLARYPLFGSTSGTFIGSATLPGQKTTYSALPVPSVSALNFSTSGGALELAVNADTPQATNPAGLTATYSIKVSNQETGSRYTYGPFRNDKSTLSEILQSSSKELLFGVGQNLSVSVIANYTLDGSPIGSVSSSASQATVTDAALELPGVTNIQATAVNDQNGNPTMASLSFVAPTGQTSQGWALSGYDVVGKGTNGQTLVDAYFPASGSTGASSNVAQFGCETGGTCSVLIDGLISGFTYGFTVMPVYVNGSSDVLGASAMLSPDLTMTQGISAGASNIVLAPGSSSSSPTMTASWEPPASGSTNGLSVSGYLVQLYQDGKNSNVPVGAPQMVTSPHAAFSSLNEADSYSVTVTTLFSGNGVSTIYGPTVDSASEAESLNVATAPVENVVLKATDSQTGALNISWQVQSGDSYQMPKSFVINLTENSFAGGSTTVAASAVEASTSNGVTTYTDTLTGLDPSYVYAATVVPYSGVGGTGVAGMPGESLSGATPYSTYVSNASVTNTAPGAIKVSFNGPSSTQYQVEVTDALGNTIAGSEQASGSAGSYGATFSIPKQFEGTVLFVEITPVGSSGSPSPSFEAPFTAYGAPDAVGNLQATGSGAKSVSLGWMAPSAKSQKESGAVSSYHVSWWLGSNKVGSATTTNLDYTVSGLTAGKQYTFQVVAVNSAGFESQPSQIDVTPAAGTVSGPINLSSQPTTDGLQLNWDAPTVAELGGNSLGTTPIYKVTLTNHVTNSSQSFDVSTNSYRATGLTNGDAYSVTVRAQVISASTGDTFWSAPSTIGPDQSTTPSVGPSPVGGLVAYVSSGQVVVNWNSVVGATDYLVSVNGGTPITTNDSTTYAFAATTGKEYRIEVWATNGLELSTPMEVNEFVASGPVMPVIKEGAPTSVGSPSSPLTTVPATTSDVTVSFSAPSSIGSALISSYTIDLYAKDASGQPQLLKTTTLSASQIQQGLNGVLYSHTFKGIANGDTVWANIAANSGSNESTSSQSNTLSVVGVIAAPSHVTAVPGNGAITLHFDEPASLNGATPKAAEIYWIGASKQLHAVQVKSSKLSSDTTGVYGYTITGLTNGESYKVWVAWVNQDSQIGQAGSAVDTTGNGSSTLIPYDPFPTSGVSTYVTATDLRSGTVNVSFPALSSKYNPQYVISYHKAGGTTHTMVIPQTAIAMNGAYTVPVTGLNNGVEYSFSVTAYAGFVDNSGPNGSLVMRSATATPYGLPGQVAISSLTTGSKSFSMDWSAPSDGGTPITGYSITVSSSEGVADTAAVTNGTSYSVDNLTNGTHYTVTIVADNSVGSGPATTVSVIPESAAPVVKNLVVTPTAGNNSVTLSIPQATAGNQFSPVTGYEYRYGPSNSGFDSGWKTIPSTETGSNPVVTTVDHLTNGTNYTFQVKALAGTVTTSYPDVSATPVASSIGSSGGSGGSGGGGSTITRTITVIDHIPSPSTSTSSVTQASSSSVGYAMIGADGGYFNHNAPFDNSLPGESISTGAIVGGAPAGSSGYWMVSSNGTVYDFGSAHSFGNVVNLSGKVVGMASTPNGGGYWIATNTGNVYAFGNAGNYGGVSKYGITGLTGSHALNAPIVGIAALPNGNGYYLVASDGGVFNFGSAQLYGTTYSLGLTGLTGSRPLNAPIVGMAVDPQGTGYILIGADGGIFNLGSAQFQGSTYTYGITGLTGNHPLNKPIVGGAFAPTVNGKQGYYLFGADGGVFNFGSAPYEGSDASIHLVKPVVFGFVFPS